jgi:hypothetical protein
MLLPLEGLKSGGRARKIEELITFIANLEEKCKGVPEPRHKDMCARMGE